MKRALIFWSGIQDTVCRSLLARCRAQAADIAAYRSAAGSEVRRAGAVANNGILHRPAHIRDRADLHESRFGLTSEWPTIHSQ
jgi:hypothetical protein